MAEIVGFLLHGAVDKAVPARLRWDNYFIEEIYEGEQEYKVLYQSHFWYDHYPNSRRAELMTGSILQMPVSVRGSRDKLVAKANFVPPNDVDARIVHPNGSVGWGGGSVIHRGISIRDEVVEFGKLDYPFQESVWFALVHGLNEWLTRNWEGK